MGIVFAIGVGIVFGVIIGAASGLFNSNSLNSDAKPGVTTTNADETPIKDGLEDETESQIKDKNNTSTSSDTASTPSGDSTSTTNTQNNTTTSTAQPTIEQPTNTQNPTTQNPTTQQPQQQTPAQSTRNGVVATGNGASLNVRSSSDPNSAIISQAGDGSGLTLYESANGMVRVVTANGVEGWVSEQYVAG